MSTTQLIKSRMTLLNMSNVELADKIGISTPTLRSRLKDGNWKHDEMIKLIQVLQIERPQDIFFKDGVTLSETFGDQIH